MSPVGLRSLNNWRDITLRQLARYLFVANLVVSVSQGAHTIRDGKWDMFFALLLSALGFGISGFVRQLSYRSAAYLMSGSLLLACGVAIFHGGFWAPNAFVGLATGATVVSVAVGRRAALFLVGLFAMLQLLAAHYFANGGAIGVPHRFDLAVPVNWTRITVVFTVLSVVSIHSITALMRRMEEAMKLNATLFHQLSAESEHKLQAILRQRDLEVSLQDSRRLEALGRLSGGIAHDFNNLLVVILNAADELKLEENETVRTYASEIEEAGQRGAELTHQLLTFGRRKPSETETIDFNASVQSALKLIERLLPSNISLQTQWAPNMGYIVAARVDLDKVLMNLCINARDAMPQGGRLTLSTQLVSRLDQAGETRNFACLTVQDSGVGMNEEVRRRIFEPFFTTREIGKGTGLGLSVVHGAVEQFEGIIEVQSNSGEGTSFRVYIPSAESRSAEAKPSLNPASGHAHGGTILLVDDDPAVRRVITETLTKAGYQVIACCDGEEALQLYERSEPQLTLVLTDAIMPNMGGYELYTQLAKKNELLPFLFLSGYLGGTFPEEFFDHPRRALLLKPFRAPQLLEQVARLVASAKRTV